MRAMPRCRWSCTVAVREAVALFGRFGRDASGATAIEYGLIAGLIFLAIAPAIILIANGIITLPLDQIGAALAAIVG